MPYSICKDEDMKLRMRMAAFCEQTQIHRGLALTMVTTYGIIKNNHSNIANSEITMDDLFEKI